MDAVVDVGLSPFLRTGALDSIEVPRNLLSRDLRRRRVGRIGRFEDDGLDEDSPDRQLADDRRHHDMAAAVTAIATATLRKPPSQPATPSHDGRSPHGGG